MKEMKFNIAAAIELFYSQNDLCNKDIMRIFGCSSSHASTLKGRVKKQMAEEGAHPVVFDASNVNAEYAFKVWGLDIADLERKYKKLMKFRELRGDPSPAVVTA